MTHMADIHCHLLPYVDDGAVTIEMTYDLLCAQAEQGVDTVCMTPHLRRDLFETPDEELFYQFSRLQRVADKLRLTLCLGREYHMDRLFLEKLEEGELLPLGMGNTLLLEFSGGHSFEQMQTMVRMLQRDGYGVLIAHVERYPALRRDVARCVALREMGAELQCNSSSILGREGMIERKFCHQLLKRELVSVVASDAHDLTRRIPDLGACAEHLRRRYGDAYARRLVCDNPRRVLNL